MGNKRIRTRLLQKLERLLLGAEAKPPFKITGVNVTCGRESYHNGNFVAKGRGKISIGNFCAFGADIKLIVSNHNYDFPSIQYSLYKNMFGGFPYEKHSGNITIGHDVWIGDNVIVLPNVKIGNGAVIGAGAIVTKDIPDYGIAAGNPAKVLKYRFTQEQINLLNETKWWDWDDEKIRQNRPFFFNTPAQ